MKKKTRRREFLEWAILIVIVGVTYLSGWHTEAIGRVQQIILSSGIIKPDLVEKDNAVSYDFQIEDLEGNLIAFSEFKEKVVFLNFWATWCPPCIAEMPDIHDLYQKQKEKVAFVMISLDDDEEKVRRFIKRKEFEFPIYFLRSELPNTHFNTHSIPTTYVADKEGFIKIENHGMAKYNTDQVNQLLDELSESQ